MLHELFITHCTRRLKDQFLEGMNDEAITAKLIKELMVLKDTSEASSEQVLV